MVQISVEWVVRPDSRRSLCECAAGICRRVKFRLTLQRSLKESAGCNAYALFGLSMPLGMQLRMEVRNALVKRCSKSQLEWR